MQTAMSGMQEQNVLAHKRQLNMEGKAPTDADAAEKAKMREACEGFEAIFIQQMWQQMRASLPDDGLFTSSKEEKFWQGMYDQELAKSMASSGGIGLADMMMEQMSPKGTAPASEASKESAPRSNGLEVPPAPLLSAEASANLSKAEQPNALQSAQSNQNIAMSTQNAPIMDSIYDSPLEESLEANALASQKLDNTAPIAPTAAEEVNLEPIVTRITYQTNRPENKRAAEDLIAELLQKQEAQAQKAFEEQQAKAAAEALAQSAPINEELEEMTPVMAAPTTVTFTPEPVQNNEPNDILAGISQSYVRNENTQNYRRTERLGRSFAEQIAAQSQLQPTNAGGPDMVKPQVIRATDELGTLNPERGSFDSPVDGKITSGFGWRLDPINGQRSWHNGVDITAEANSPVKSAADGVVSFAGYDQEFGNMIIIDHPNGLSTIYGHNGELNVQAGDFVNKGTEIASVGSSGRALGNHVHFEIRKADMPINPESVLIQQNAIYS